MPTFRNYIAIIFAMIFWSGSFIWTRMAINSFPPVTLISLRLLIASVLLFVVIASARKLQKIRKADLKWFVLLAFFEPYLYYMGETYGLTMVESTLASVIVSTIPLFAPVLAFFVLKERISLANIFGIIVSLGGVFLVIYEPSGGFNANPLGVALLFLAVFAAICYSAILRKISSHYKTINIIFYQSVIGLFFFIPTFFATDFGTLHQIIVTREAIVSLLMLSVFASVIAFVLFADVVRKIGVARSNVFVNLIPVFTAIFAKLLLNEDLNWLKAIGIFVVVVGLFVSQFAGTKLKQIKGIEY
jgi:drug/metabolite transporter (DMT)-like permease